MASSLSEILTSCLEGCSWLRRSLIPVSYTWILSMKGKVERWFVSGSHREGRLSGANGFRANLERLKRFGMNPQ